MSEYTFMTEDMFGRHGRIVWDWFAGYKTSRDDLLEVGTLTRRERIDWLTTYLGAYLKIEDAHEKEREFEADCRAEGLWVSESGKAYPLGVAG